MRGPTIASNRRARSPESQGIRRRRANPASSRDSPSTSSIPPSSASTSRWCLLSFHRRRPWLLCGACSHAHRPGPGVSRWLGHGVPCAAAGHRASGHTNDARAGQRRRNALAGRPRARTASSAAGQLAPCRFSRSGSRYTGLMLSDVQHALETLPLDDPLVVLADFDGTLAEFHPNPAAPMLTDVRREWLRDIAAQPMTFTGIVSGRRVADLRRACAASFARLLRRSARHGDRGRRPLAASRSRAGARAAVRELCRVSQLVRRSVRRRGPGGQAASRGRARPRRRAYDSVRNALALADACAEPWIANGDLRRLEGNAVVEYLPNIACHKGDATRGLPATSQAQIGASPWVVFVGDDITDEDAFRAIDCGIGVLVGLAPDARHAPARRHRGCRYAFLRWLAAEDNGQDSA